MPKKLKKGRSTPRLVQRPLCLSDRLLLRRTYLDGQMVERLERLTAELLLDDELVSNEFLRARVVETLSRLQSEELNNAYDFLESLIEVWSDEPKHAEAVLRRIEIHFGTDCIRLINLYTHNKHFDV